MSREQFEKEYGENHGKGVIDPAKPWFVLVQKKAAPAKRLSFSRLVLKLANWALLSAGAIALGCYLVLEAVTALGWAS